MSEKEGGKEGGRDEQCEAWAMAEAVTGAIERRVL